MNRTAAGLAALLLSPLFLLAASSPSSAATQLVNPRPLTCHVLQGNGAEVCAKKKTGRVDWSKGWWADPAKFKVIDANIATETVWTIPSDGYKAFSLTGYVGINARRGFDATLKMPRRKPGVSVSVFTGKRVKSMAYSEGAWTTKDGIFPCGVPESEQTTYAPTALTGVVAANPTAKEFSIQWGIWGAPVRCDDGPISNPTSPEVSSDAFTTRYRAAALRKGDLFKLPVRASWTGESSDGGKLTIRTFGSVVIRRIQHRIR